MSESNLSSSRARQRPGGKEQDRSISLPNISRTECPPRGRDGVEAPKLRACPSLQGVASTARASFPPLSQVSQSETRVRGSAASSRWPRPSIETTSQRHGNELSRSSRALQRRRLSIPVGPSGAQHRLSALRPRTAIPYSLCFSLAIQFYACLPRGQTIAVFTNERIRPL